MKTAAIELLRRRESRRQYLRVILLILAAYAFVGGNDARAGDMVPFEEWQVDWAAQEYVNKECAK